MVDKAEIDNGGKELEALKAEVAKQEVKEIKADFERLALQASRLKAEIDQKINQDREAPEFKGNPKDKNSEKAKARNVKQAVLKILIAGGSKDKILTSDKENLAATEIAKKVIEQLSSKISLKDVSEQSAPYLYELLSKVVNGEISTIDGLVREFFNLTNLHQVNPDLFEKLQKSLFEVAKSYGVPEEKARKTFLLTETDIGMSPNKSSFENDCDKFLENFGPYYYEESDEPLIKAMFIPSEFVKLVEKEKIKLSQEGFSGVNLDKKVSQKISNDIVLLYGKLTARLDTLPPEKFYEEVIQQDFWQGIQIAQIRLDTAINQLQRYFETHQKDIGGSYKFYVSGTEEIEEERIYEYKTQKKNDKGNFIRNDEGEIEEEKHPVTKIYHRLRPTPKQKEASISKFIQYSRLLGYHEYKTREYTHNVRAMFLMPGQSADEGGFYKRLAGYAEKMSGTDIDEINLLPDSNIIQTASGLYHKFLEEEFAIRSWIHTPDLFQPEYGEAMTKVESEVYDKLTKLFPDMVGKDEWRLRRALSMAIGISRGVDMNEEEMSSSADPSVNPDGTTRYDSYYTRDPFALTPFNPIHLYYRWQAQDVSIASILFCPVEFKDGGIPKRPDHNTIWRKMTENRSSFLKGKKAFTDEGELLLFDFINNIGSAGGPETRGGWRYTFGYEGWFVNSKGESLITKENMLENWKIIENIGYEVLQDFANNKIKDGFFVEVNKENKQNVFTEEGEKLFQYLFKRYILEQNQIDQLTMSNRFTEIDQLTKDKIAKLRSLYEEEAEKTANKKIAEGELGKKEKDKFIKEWACRRMLQRVLVGVVAQRFPSKIIKMERDRWNNNGKRAWQDIRERLEWNGNKGIERFDNAMKNIALAESSIRQEMSAKMHQGLEDSPEDTLEEDGPKKSLKLAEINERYGKDYRLTKNAIEKLTTRGLITKNECDDAVRVFEQIETNIINNDKKLDEFTDIFINKKKYPFALGIDELDKSFLSFKGSGPRILARAIGDLSLVELDCSNELNHYIQSFRKIALDYNNKDFTPLLESLTKMKKAISTLHSQEKANKVVHHLALLAINYFRLDARAEGLIGQILYRGQINSLAARFAMRPGHVWEWKTEDVDAFIHALETNNILAKDPIDLGLTMEEAKKNIKTKYYPIKIFGKTLFKIPYKVRQDFKEDYSGNRLRKETRTDIKGKIEHILLRYTPAFLFLLLFLAIKKGLEELGGGKKQ